VGSSTRFLCHRLVGDDFEAFVKFLHHEYLSLLTFLKQRNNVPSDRGGFDENLDLGAPYTFETTKPISQVIKKDPPILPQVWEIAAFVGIAADRVKVMGIETLMELGNNS
jgi:hypothetical protein